MGLVEGLLGDLIGSSTGIDTRKARRMMRKVGMSKLLMMGGAAALGGLVMSKASGSTGMPLAGGSGGFGGAGMSGSRTQVPPSAGSGGAPTPAPPNLPPLPPVPGASVPPPPPGAPEELEPAEEELPPEAAVPAIRTMVAAALADGDLSEEERSMVLGRIGDANLPEEQAKQIRQDLVLPPSPAALAELAPAPEARETLYRLAALVLKADGKATETEIAWLGRLAEAFEIDLARKVELEEEVFD